MFHATSVLTFLSVAFGDLGQGIARADFVVAVRYGSVGRGIVAGTGC